MIKRELSGSEKRSIRVLLGRGVSPAEIARRFGINYSRAFNYTRHSKKPLNSRRRIEAANKDGFFSVSDYNDSLARRHNQPTYHDFDKNVLSHIRKQNPKNIALSLFLKEKLSRLERTASWLAKELDVSRTAADKYLRGDYLPSRDIQMRLFNLFGIQTSTKAHLDECVWPYVILDAQNADQKQIQKARIKLAYEPLEERTHPKHCKMYECKLCRRIRSEKYIIGHFSSHAFETLRKTLSL